VRSVDPWLIDNRVKDQITMEERKPVGQIQFTRMCIRVAAKERKERRVGPANAELLERWRKEDLQPGSAITATVATKNRLAALRVTNQPSLYQVQIIGLITSLKGSSLAEMARFEVVSCDSSVV
jgi:hypothetical protein